jgi:5'-nucleotidase
MSTRPWRALVTNDDGIDAPGLAVLACAAQEAGLDVVVAAPIRESSGTSAGLTSTEDGKHVLVESRELPGLPGFAVAAHPAFIVLAAAQSMFGPPPDVVLSGVNDGANVGRAVLHSGTVGAALTGALHGARALAVSLAVPVDSPRPRRWDSVRAVLREVLPLITGLPAGVTLNVNVPDRPVDRLGELRRVPLARIGTVQTRIERLGTNQLRRVAAPLPDDLEPGTDAAMLVAGHPTISELRPVEDANPTVLPESLPCCRPVAPPRAGAAGHQG